MVEEWIRSLSESELEQYKKILGTETIYSALDGNIIYQILLEIPTVKKYPKRGLAMYMTRFLLA